ncbi:MAG: BrnT family toxin [Candidatus Brocadiales bacterium]|nr:BrnT family toxin [Candidatus Brocadiales bacterium]
MQYNFAWDPEKAINNWKKHKVRFEQAATVFRDPLAVTIYDIKHSDNEDRWITLGIASTGNVLVVNHTFKEVDTTNVNIRIFSSRKSTKLEKQQYLEGNR